ncbi:hypothetical protein PC129_g12690 [Phytophthora cactorum]|uniref:Uncharacterized protein n=1 Tax=Phytophthora cactorum TaxID=29920 RepID=A0A329RQY6_9STRA|nr:hypothetical protein PC111_g14483 [Phytophthora cactorum]KAG3152218.1 hypothetical protein C6341_g16339 [Phytophthora cactorum]KAG3216455.1 hypothetical protein PC129_g12690 [Phytophthora cactorum]RAW27147.1 hypothetical protein PC110_g16458 [Phytophthora cactorum]
MDCVILVYQSNASVDILNSVVNQNMWVRRRCVQDTGGEREILNKFKASTELQTELKDNDQNPGTILEGGNVGVAASLASGKLPSTSGVDSLKVKSAEVAPKSSKGARANTEPSRRSGPCRIYYADVMKDNAQVATAKTSASRSGVPPMKTLIRQSKRADPPTEVLFADVMKATSSSGDIADSDNGLFVGTASMPVAYTKSVVQADTAEACSQNSSFSGGRASI